MLPHEYGVASVANVIVYCFNLRAIVVSCFGEAEKENVVGGEAGNFLQQGRCRFLNAEAFVLHNLRKIGVTAEPCVVYGVYLAVASVKYDSVSPYILAMAFVLSYLCVWSGGRRKTCRNQHYNEHHDGNNDCGRPVHTGWIAGGNISFRVIISVVGKIYNLYVVGRKLLYTDWPLLVCLPGIRVE